MQKSPGFGGSCHNCRYYNRKSTSVVQPLQCPAGPAPSLRVPVVVLHKTNASTACNFNSFAITDSWRPKQRGQASTTKQTSNNHQEPVTDTFQSFLIPPQFPTDIHVVLGKYIPLVNVCYESTSYKAFHQSLPNTENFRFYGTRK